MVCFPFIFQEGGHLGAILSCLTGRQIVEACQLAQKVGDHMLALLLAQASSSYVPRQMVAKQLEEMVELRVSTTAQPFMCGLYFCFFQLYMSFLFLSICNHSLT